VAIKYKITTTDIFNTIGCIAGDFSKTDCIAKEMLLNSNGGAIAFIGNSRYGWFDETDVKRYSGEYQIEFFKRFFQESASLGETLGRSKMEFISKCNEHNPYRTLSTTWTTLTYGTVTSPQIGAVYPLDKSISVPIHPHNPDPAAVLWNWGQFEEILD